MVKFGTKNFNDRRGAMQRIIDQVEKDGCMPDRYDRRSLRNLMDAGAIHFGPTPHGYSYKIGPEPKEED